jgi:hypothetical protein
MPIKNTTPINNLYPIANATSSSSPFVDVFNTRDPTSNDVAYPIQKKWLNTLTGAFWELQNFVSANGIVTANWVKIGSTLAAESLTGNSGGTVFPDSSNNINIVGDGISVNVVGTPATHTLTINVTGFEPDYTSVTHAMSPYTVLPTDTYLSVDCSAGPVTLNFPNVPNFKETWTVKDRTGNASINNISITTPGATVTFDGHTTYIITSNYGAVNLLANAIPTYEVF